MPCVKGRIKLYFKPLSEGVFLMKRKILCLSVLAIMLAILAAGTLAYFTAEGRTRNVITTGSIKISVVEQQLVDDKLVDYPNETIKNVMPGAEISKIVTIKNTGSSEAWIRVKVDKSITRVDNGKADTSLVLLDFDTDNWVEKDGYYYYIKPVPAGEITTALFNTVTFDPQMGNEYQNCEVSINVIAQAVQTANNTPADGDVLKVAGWPQEKGE